MEASSSAVASGQTTRSFTVTIWSWVTIKLAQGPTSLEHAELLPTPGPVDARCRRDRLFVLGVGFAPVGHSLEDGDQGEAFVGELVAGIATAGFNDTLGLQITETGSQGARVNGRDCRLEVTEAFRTAREVAQYEGGPFAADNMHRGADAANSFF